MAKGFCMLSKELMDSEYYFSERFTRMQAYLDLCLLAEWKDRKFIKRGQVVELKAGQLAKSEEELAERWQWSRNTVRKYLNEQQSIGNIEQQKSRLITIITVKFGLNTAQQIEQQTLLKSEQQIEQQNEQHTIDNIIDNIEDNNKEKETKVSKKKSGFQKPTIEELSSYILEKGYHFDAERFHAYYESNGWMVGKNKMKDWKAACRTWESKRKEEMPSLFSQQEQEYQGTSKIEWE